MNQTDSDHTPVPIAQSFSSSNRVLNDEEKEKLAKESNTSDFKRNKLELEARKNWDLFYKRNTTNFFKDRHWTCREFSELSNLNDGGHRVLLEAGCGCGNAVFPLLEENENIFIYACDFSQRAVDFVKNNPLYNEKHIEAFQFDLTENSLADKIPSQCVDIALLLFVLSAITPEKMEAALKNICDVIKPGGMLLFRDYGLYDHAQLRFKSGHKIKENFYVRQDGTRAYFFSLDVVQDLFQASGFEVVENKYVHKRTVNKKEGIDVGRIFVQGKFMKK